MNAPRLDRLLRRIGLGASGNKRASFDDQTRVGSTILTFPQAENAANGDRYCAERQESGAAGEGVMDRVIRYARHFICGLQGHDALLHFEQSRLSLQCTSCGYETPGWDLQTAPPRQTVRERKMRLPLFRKRRAA